MKLAMVQRYESNGAITFFKLDIRLQKYNIHLQSHHCIRWRSMFYHAVQYIVFQKVVISLYLTVFIVSGGKAKISPLSETEMYFLVFSITPEIEIVFL